MTTPTQAPAAIRAMITVPRWALEKIRSSGNFWDEGPPSEGWPSEEMQKALDVIDAALD